MRLFTLVRTSPAVWLGPVLVLVSLKYSLILPPAVKEPYALALTTVGAWTIAIIGPFCAACAAWEGGRLRRAHWYDRPHARPTAVIVARVVAPVLLVGWTALAAAVAIQFLNAGAIHSPDIRVVAIAAMVIIAQSLVGLAVGIHVTSVIAIPAVLLVGFTWMIVPFGIEPLWLRHLTGVWGTCCSPAEDLALEAVAGAALVATAFIVMAAILLSRKLDGLRVAMALLSLAAGFAGGSSLVDDLGRTPAVARGASSLVCAGSEPRVCVWPEHRGRLELTLSVVQEASAKWQALGVTVPAGFTEQLYPSSPDGFATFGISPTSGRADVLLSLASGLLSPQPVCAPAGEATPLGDYSYHDFLEWLASVGGLSDQDLARRFPPRWLSPVLEIRKSSLQEQQQWFATAVRKWRACDTQPRLEAPK